MLLFRTIVCQTKLPRNCLGSSKNLTRAFSLTAVQNDNSIDMAYDIYENANTPNYLPPLIIMHGLFGSKHNYRGIANLLLQYVHKRRIYVVDARNHGESPHTAEHQYQYMTEDIVKLMNKENYKRFAIMGNCMGARCMMYMALKYPHLVEKAVFVENSPVSVNEPYKQEATSILDTLKQINIPNNTSLNDALVLADNELKRKIDDKWIRDFVLTNLKHDADGQYQWRINVDTLQKNFPHIYNFPPEVKRLKYLGPVLFIGGTKSNHLRKTEKPEIKKIFPRAYISFIEGAGHYLHAEKPDIFIFLVKQFLNTLHIY